MLGEMKDGWQEKSRANVEFERQLLEVIEEAETDGTELDAVSNVMLKLMQNDLESRGVMTRQFVEDFARVAAQAFDQTQVPEEWVGMIGARMSHDAVSTFALGVCFGYALRRSEHA